MNTAGSTGRRNAVLATAAAWAGFLVGVSFLATPVKFLAPSLSLPVALDVGRQTFYALNRCELLLCVVLVIVVLRGLPGMVPRLLTGLCVVLVLSQTLWLIPALDGRVSLILAGVAPEPSSLHTIYIGVELAKLAALIALAILAACQRRPV